MRVKTFAFCSILILSATVHAQAQEYEAVELADRLRGRARLYEPLIASAAQRYHVDPRLLWTIAYLESRFRQDAISYKDGKPCAYGMMQFTAPTAARYDLKDPHSVKEAIDAAARYVRDLQARFGGRGDLILAAYNAGEGTVEAFRDGKRLALANRKIINPRSIRTGGIPPYPETREYVARGQIVYQKISRDGLLLSQIRAEVKGSINVEPSSQRRSEDAPRQGSIYVSESSESRPTGPLKSEKNKGAAKATSSIYVN